MAWPDSMGIFSKIIGFFLSYGNKSIIMDTSWGTSSFWIKQGPLKALLKMGLFLCLFSLLPHIQVTVVFRIFTSASPIYHLRSVFLNHHLGPDKNDLLHTSPHPIVSSDYSTFRPTV